jgi:hypothetical protein
MPAAKLNLIIEQGTTWKHSLVLKAGAATAPAVNLLGFTARMHIRSELADASTLAELTSANGRITITPATGQIDLMLSATDTAALGFERAVYDLEIESATGEVTRILQGFVNLSLEVTR